MRLFWMAWGLALLLIVVTVGSTAWVISASDAWPRLWLVASRALCLVALLAAFVGAFRLALLGTVSLKLVLAQNLAILIAMELDDLRRAAQERASSLAGQAGADKQATYSDAWRSSEALQIPRFFGDRDDIRKLLGKATEHTLEQVLLSLQSYNETVMEVRSQSAGDSGIRRNAVLQLWRKIGVIQDRINQAASAVAPFCRSA